MLKKQKITFIFSIIYFSFFSLQARAADTVKLLHPILALDKRAAHKDEVLLRALELTEEEYGAFTVESVHVDMTTERAFSSLKTGELINVFIAPSSPEWKKKTIEIKVPIRQGLLSYRLLLVNKVDLPKFKAVKTFSELKKLTAGLQNGWVTSEIFEHLGMSSVKGHNFEGLFLMLDKHRFNYIPRAIYEIYDELNSRKDQINNVVIEPTLALYLPMATYVYVSSNEPVLAKRIEHGLKELVATGEMESILFKYYAKEIEQANIKSRHIIEIDNPFFDSAELNFNKALSHKE